jgi:hypothetical protein
MIWDFNFVRGKKIVFLGTESEMGKCMYVEHKEQENELKWGILSLLRSGDGFCAPHCKRR